MTQHHQIANSNKRSFRSTNNARTVSCAVHVSCSSYWPDVAWDQQTGCNCSGGSSLPEASPTANIRIEDKAPQILNIRFTAPSYRRL
jgi:hypothetical protein